MILVHLNCPACRATVHVEDRILFVEGLLFGYTWDGKRMRWTRLDSGAVVHQCDRARRARVLAVDPRPVANPPWRRLLFRWRFTRPYAERLYDTPEYLPRAIVEGTSVA